MLLEVLLGRSDELDGSKLVAILVNGLHNIKRGYALKTNPRVSNREMMGPMSPRYGPQLISPFSYTAILLSTYLDAIRLNGNEAVDYQFHRQSVVVELPRQEDVRLFVRHGVVVEPCGLESLRCGCTKEGLGLGAQVFVDGRITVLLLGHLEFQ